MAAAHQWICHHAPAISKPAYQLMARLGAATWMRDHGFDDRPDLSAATALMAHIDP